MSISKNNFLPLIEKRNRKKYQLLKRIQNNNICSNQSIKNFISEDNNLKNDFSKSQILKHDRSEKGINLANKYVEKLSQNKLSFIQSDKKINFKIKTQNDLLSSYLSNIKKTSDHKSKIGQRVVIISPLKLSHKSQKSKLKTEQCAPNPELIYSKHNSVSSTQQQQKLSLLQKYNLIKHNISLNMQNDIRIQRYYEPNFKQQKCTRSKKYFNDKIVEDGLNQTDQVKDVIKQCNVKSCQQSNLFSPKDHKRRKRTCAELKQIHRTLVPILCQQIQRKNSQIPCKTASSKKTVQMINVDFGTKYDLEPWNSNIEDSYHDYSQHYKQK